MAWLAKLKSVKWPCIWSLKGRKWCHPRSPKIDSWVCLTVDDYFPHWNCHLQLFQTHPFINPRQVTLGGAGAPATTVWAFLGRFGKMCRLRNGQEKENLDGRSESKESRHFTSVPNFSCPLLVESISAGWPTLGSGAGPTFVLVGKVGAGFVGNPVQLGCHQISGVCRQGTHVVELGQIHFFLAFGAHIPTDALASDRSCQCKPMKCSSPFHQVK